ncbi:MAG: ATP-binding protein, partial [Deltaproteobacteria bacterium]|nr:ATP-binding protein [Deltaproteobacteria bacterium]
SLRELALESGKEFSHNDKFAFERQHFSGQKRVTLSGLLKKATMEASPPETLDGRGRLIAMADRIAECFSLTMLERELIRLIVASTWIKPISMMLSHFNLTYRLSFSDVRCREILAQLLGVRPHECTRLFDRNSGLIKNGLFQYSSEDVNLSGAFKLILASTSSKDVRKLILSKNRKAALAGDDFFFLGDDYSHVVNLLKSAIKHKTLGINILLYGQPGTGKTEFTKTVCAEIGAELYSVSESMLDSRGNDRLAEATLAKALVRTNPKAILMFDEAEDVFNQKTKEKYSKLLLNRFLEKNENPVIWITNAVDWIDPAHQRRFTFALEMKTPPPDVRGRLWEKELTKNKIHLEKHEIEELARDYELPPSFAASAIKAVKLTKNKKALKKTLDSLEKAITGKIKSDCSVGLSHRFEIRLLNADEDLQKLTERIHNLKTLDFSLCLYGPPGSGKSEYARHLAKEMGLHVLHKRASELQSMFLGETEKNIAGAFREAKQQKKFLIFDEADSFLQDRTKAVRNWEISQVNEMLTWMESHPLPFACTTNLMESMDKASLRRFTFKVKIGYLSKKQAGDAFNHFFGLDREIDIPSLTPADFALVAKRAKILGLESSEELYELLKAEVKIKGEANNKIGYVQA